jgi:hypothetical protein
VQGQNGYFLMFSVVCRDFSAAIIRLKMMKILRMGLRSPRMQRRGYYPYMGYIETNPARFASRDGKMYLYRYLSIHPILRAACKQASFFYCMFKTVGQRKR